VLLTAIGRQRGRRGLCEAPPRALWSGCGMERESVGSVMYKAIDLDRMAVCVCVCVAAGCRAALEGTRARARAHAYVAGTFRFGEL
jgi:hypothetical protein